MVTSQQGIDLIKSFESLQLKAYLCPAKVWTIGYGHTVGVKPGDVITKDQAECFLKADLVRFEQDIKKVVRVPLTQGQFDAIASFTFNCGSRALSTSTLLRKLNQKDFDGAADEFERWIYAGGKIFAGLERRRRLEKRMFKS